MRLREQQPAQQCQPERCRRTQGVSLINPSWCCRSVSGWCCTAVSGSRKRITRDNAAQQPLRHELRREPRTAPWLPAAVRRRTDSAVPAVQTVLPYRLCRTLPYRLYPAVQTLPYPAVHCLWSLPHCLRSLPYVPQCTATPYTVRVLLRLYTDRATPVVHRPATARTTDRPAVQTGAGTGTLPAVHCRTSVLFRCFTPFCRKCPLIPHG